MKKLPAFLLLFFIAMFLWPQDGSFDPIDSDVWEWDDTEGDDENDDELEAPAPVKKKFRIKNRTAELSLANIAVNVSNNFIAAADVIKNPFYLTGHINDIKKDPISIYQDKVTIDLDDFFGGFRFDFEADIKPFSFNFNWKDKWGFGLDIGHISAAGNVSLSGKMLTFAEVENEKSGAGGAVFADVGIPVLFHIKDLKIKLRPAGYTPVIYAEPDITYNYLSSFNNETGQEGMRLQVDYDMRIYSIIGLHDFNTDDMMQDLQDNARNIAKNNLGYDFGISVEYPFNSRLDVGVDIVNMPFVPAKLNNYMRVHGMAFVDTSQIDIDTLISGKGEIPEDFWDDVYGYEFEHENEYDAKGKKIFRPFTMLSYAHYRPFNSQLLTLIPSLGFSINKLYPKAGAVEGGLSVRLDLANIFITTLGINYNNRKWKNSIDFVFNFRAFELDFGLSTQSQRFSKSWRGAGLGLNFGLKLGF